MRHYRVGKLYQTNAEYHVILGFDDYDTLIDWSKGLSVSARGWTVSGIFLVTETSRDSDGDQIALRILYKDHLVWVSVASLITLWIDDEGDAY